MEFRSLNTLLINIDPSVSHISPNLQYLHSSHIGSLPSDSISYERYIFSIYGIQMLAQHLKEAHFHGNTIFKFIP